eukprot:scaffold535659_cov19-Prasinocladus_malaysianus.AAC.1
MHCLQGCFPDNLPNDGSLAPTFDQKRLMMKGPANLQAEHNDPAEYIRVPISQRRESHHDALKNVTCGLPIR